MTKVDQLCEDVKKDITNIYKSIKVRDAVEIASETFGINKSCIHPVRNHTTEISLETNTNIPLLIALKQARDFAADRVEFVLRKEKKDY